MFVRNTHVSRVHGTLKLLCVYVSGFLRAWIMDVSLLQFDRYPGIVLPFSRNRLPWQFWSPRFGKPGLRTTVHSEGSLLDFMGFKRFMANNTCGLFLANPSSRWRSFMQSLFRSHQDMSSAPVADLEAGQRLLIGAAKVARVT